MPHVTINYQPREAFFGFHNRTQKRGVMICHRRAGKTVAAINELQKCALIFTPPKGFTAPGRFAFMAPTRVRVKDIAWAYLKQYAKPIPGIKIMESELSVEYPNGARVTCYGADSDRGMGLYLDGIVFDECDEINATVDAVVLPALADRDGWAMWIGILRGRHNLWKRYEGAKFNPEFFTLLLRASESKILRDDTLEEMKAPPPRGIGSMAYELQMECNPNVSVADAIYGEEMDVMRKENRIRPIAVESMYPLYAFWDIGHSDRGDDIAWWLMQFCQRDILVHSYFASTGHPPVYYVEKMREEEARLGKNVLCDYLPHDGSRRNMVGKTFVDYMKDAGKERIKVVHRTPDVWTSINGVRVLMARVYIDPRGCGKTWTLGEREMPSGVDCLDYYHKKEDSSTGIIEDVIVHDEYSHGADAFRTMGEAYALKMLEGTSELARAGKTPAKVLRGPGPDSYPWERGIDKGPRVLR